ncbi:heat shock protein [Cyclospora cayetanensis]|uniref:Heat shock protein n=1 Tax=Cyclospora cayetanensis TaxID=88456 RepID=A0A1D3D2W9_9EIME|nr:heat shock protein [Cyclospora cayetanensis]
MLRWLRRVASLALLLLSGGNDMQEVSASLPLRPTPDQDGKAPNVLYERLLALLLRLQRAPSELNFDVQLMVETMDVFAWHMHHDRIALAHLIMVLLEGSRLESEKPWGPQLRVYTPACFVDVTVPLGKAELTPAVLEVFLRAHRMAAAEGALVGMQHVFLVLLQSPTFYKILLNSGCDIDIFKDELALAYKNTPMPVTSGTTHHVSQDFDLSQYGEDLTEKARNGRLQPVIGRQDEIDRIAQILSRMMTKAPLLIGEPGVGKTVIIEGLAQRIIEGAVPRALRGRRIFSLDLLNLSAGTSMRGEFEKRMKEIISYLQEHKKSVILFVDEIHSLVGAGKAAGSSDATQILKVPLARGDIVLVGATTLEEYKLHIEKDAAFCRRFQNIVVEAPSKESAMSILLGLRHHYEQFHNVDISEEVIDQIVNLSDRYVKQRSFPDKAIDLLDESCSWKKVSYNKQLVLLRKKISSAEMQGSETTEEDLKAMREELAALEALTAGGKRLELTVHDVAHILSIWTGIPMGKMTEDEISRVLRLADILSLKVVGQYQAVKAVSDALAIQRAGLSPRNKPLGSFLFLGSSGLLMPPPPFPSCHFCIRVLWGDVVFPYSGNRKRSGSCLASSTTFCLGVGKTELAKAVAQEMFHSEKNLIRLDMVEYQEAHSISRLIGPPPGYMGNDEGGQLTEAVRQKPHSVIVFDEAENAHKNLWSLLLPMLDEGHLSDSKGNRVDFTSCLIILTSNIGQQFILDGYKEARAIAVGNKAIGPSTSDEGGKGGAGASGSFKIPGKLPSDVLKRMRQNVLKEVFGYFKPQVIGRMSEVIIFEPLNEQAMKGVLGLKLAALVQSMASKGVDFRVTNSAIQFILERAWSYKYGGRRMGKYLEKYIKSKLAPLLISGKLKSGDRAILARSKVNTNQLILIVCELDDTGTCLTGTKYGTKLVTQEAKAQDADDGEESIE